MSLKEDDGGNQGSFSLNKELFEDIAVKIADILMIDFGIGIILGWDIFPHNKCGMSLREQNYFCWCPSGFAILSNVKVILQGGIIAILLRLDLRVAN